MTVSLALRNSREVSAATRRKIHRLAAHAGYTPDPAITRLMHHLRLRAPARFKTTIHGIGERFSSEQISRGNYGDRLHSGLQLRCAALGFTYERLFLDDFSSGSQLARVLLSRGVEGLVILPLRKSSDLTDLLDWTRFATVAATPAVQAPLFHSAMPNHFDNMMALCQNLRREGCERIGLAIPEDWNRRVKYRWAGGIAWQNLFGETKPIRPLFTHAPGPNLDSEEFSDWLEREKPDAVITDSTHQSALTPGLSRLPPRARPKIVTMNWPDGEADAGIDQRGEQIGAAAVDLLAGMLTRGELGVPEVPRTTMVEGVWVGGTFSSATNPPPSVNA